MDKMNMFVVMLVLLVGGGFAAIQNVMVTPPHPNSDTNLNCSFDVNATGNYNITWYDNKQHMLSYDTTVNCNAGDTCYTNKLVPASVTAKDDKWICYVSSGANYNFSNYQKLTTFTTGNSKESHLYGTSPSSNTYYINLQNDSLVFHSNIHMADAGDAWYPDSSLSLSLHYTGLRKVTPTVGFNITGDGKWVLIGGESAGTFYGYYWSGSSWVKDNNRVAGLGDVGSYSHPTAAFNVTGDGNWTLIVGKQSPGVLGFYWNGTQWVNDSSRVSGIYTGYFDVEPTLGFNITGAGHWDLIIGEYNRGTYGYHWNGNNWVQDSGVSSGLSTTCGHTPTPAVGMINGEWRLIGGSNCYRNYGYYRGTATWVRDDINTIGGIEAAATYYFAPTIFTGLSPNRTNLIFGDDWGYFTGKYWGYTQPTDPYLKVNATQVWNQSGNLTYATTTNMTDAINNYISGCSSTICDVPITLSTNGYATVDIGDTIEYSEGEQITNTPPTISNVHITPDPANVSSTLICNGDYSDIDGDAESGSVYQWFRNGHLIAAQTHKTISGGLFTKGDTVSCKYFPNDGISLVSMNTTTAGVVEGTWCGGGKQVFEKGNPDPMLVFDNGGSLPGDSLDLVLTVFQSSGGVYLNGTDLGSSNQVTLSLPYSITSANSPISFVATSDESYQNVQICDGNTSHPPYLLAMDDNLSPNDSSQITIVNALPTISNVHITPDPAYQDTATIDCEGTYSDADGDTETGSTYRWFKNGNLLAGETAKTLSNSSFSHFDNIMCEYTPYDGYNYGTAVNSTALTISNTLPTISDVAISPSSAHSNDLLTCNGAYSDIDGDVELGSTYRWFKNGEQVVDVITSNDESVVPEGHSTSYLYWTMGDDNSQSYHDGVNGTDILYFYSDPTRSGEYIDTLSWYVNDICDNITNAHSWDKCGTYNGDSSGTLANQTDVYLYEVDDDHQTWENGATIPDYTPGGAYTSAGTLIKSFNDISITAGAWNNITIGHQLSPGKILEMVVCLDDYNNGSCYHRNDDNHTTGLVIRADNNEVPTFRGHFKLYYDDASGNLLHMGNDFDFPNITYTGVYNRPVTTKILPSTYTSEGNSMVCEYTPSDGYDYGSPMNSSSIPILQAIYIGGGGGGGSTHTGDIHISPLNVSITGNINSTGISHLTISNPNGYSHVIRLSSNNKDITLFPGVFRLGGKADRTIEVDCNIPSSQLDGLVDVYVDGVISKHVPIQCSGEPNKNLTDSITAFMLADGLGIGVAQGTILMVSSVAGAYFEFKRKKDSIAYLLLSAAVTIWALMRGV